ncbi:MAG: DeoR/GlpR transcriptional regulator [Acidimicrobiia bacterium]|nr:DeoR/GlpR family DNA-binding transcription regulator [Acidimicrobiia bacterium]MBT8247667.1 DeoR/GlpR family DNA-binding transcription regulator [Acidimicrobiia bacterium]NNF89043.1 DeoR/GlpR transcriptional regulator [Acidimicrobiia bacterium]NNJ46265.1 DeoR/GlpR transcriptional regulator [Acidimicrobiia bacterium]NNL14867.1 DeoR/GlpR transcriptional regulator [Acidimicrobiia bacterium]
MLAALAEREFVRVTDLSDMFGISEVTVRHDLETLQDAGLLRRVHGGAVVAPPQPERPFEQSLGAQAEEKRRMGEAAAALVTSGETIILDVGSTTAAVARALVARSDLNDVICFTNGLKVALELEPAIPRFTVVLTGGTLRPLQHSLVDPLAGVILDDIHADTVFLGCNGIDVEAGVTNVNLPEAEIKRRMVRAARRRIVLATGDKLGVASLAPLCTIDDVTMLITDTSADPGLVTGLREADLQVLVV